MNQLQFDLGLFGAFMAVLGVCALVIAIDHFAKLHRTLRSIAQDARRGHA